MNPAAHHTISGVGTDPPMASAPEPHVRADATALPFSVVVPPDRPGCVWGTC